MYSAAEWLWAKKLGSFQFHIGTVESNIKLHEIAAMESITIVMQFIILFNPLLGRLLPHSKVYTHREFIVT